MSIIEPVAWSPDGIGVRILDQRALPAREAYLDLRTVDDVHEAIASLAVRGAPAIGIAGAMGLMLGVSSESAEAAFAGVDAARTRIDGARPTAVNLAWATKRVCNALRTAPANARARDVVRAEAEAILAEDRAMCRRIGERGASLIDDGARVLTHCNAGALATGGIGTALAAVYIAVEQGKRVEVFANETRPLLQGSRLTAWELQRAGIPVTVLVDGAAAALMREKSIDLCIVGADRIAANGDAANKIGTYGLAIVAAHHGIPFYVAAPTSTFDTATPSGDDIQIEQRNADELRCGFCAATAPPDIEIYNPAFDVTPASLVTAIISDRAIHVPPYQFSHVR